EEARRLCRASADAVSGIGEFCRANRIDAHFRHDGWIWAAVNRAQMGSWSSEVAALERAGARPLPFVELSPEETAARTGSAVHIGGVFEPTAATVQPALLAFGLRRVAMERGVRIHEGSAMTRLERGARPGGRILRGCLPAPGRGRRRPPLDLPDAVRRAGPGQLDRPDRPLADRPAPVRQDFRRRRTLLRRRLLGERGRAVLPR